MNYIVTDDDGNVSFSAKKEAPETFKTFAAAEKRAKELADTAPGVAIGIYQRIGTCLASVNPPKVTRQS